MTYMMNSMISFSRMSWRHGGLLPRRVSGSYRQRKNWVWS